MTNPNKHMNRAVDFFIKTRYPEMSMEAKIMMNDKLTFRELKKGERLFDEGDVADKIVAVEEGMLRQFYYNNKKDLTEHFSYEHCTLMCLESFINETPTDLYAEALEDTKVWILNKKDLEQMMGYSKEIATYYRRVLEYSLLQSQLKARLWRYGTAKARYKHLFDTQPQVVRRAPLSFIASYLMMTPETLSRVRSSVEL